MTFLNRKKKKAAGYVQEHLGEFLLALFLLGLVLFAVFYYNGINLLKLFPEFGSNTGSGSDSSEGVSVVDSVASPEFSIATVCNIIGLSGVVTSYQATKDAQAAESVTQAALAAFNEAPEVLVQEGSKITAKLGTGAEATTVYSIKNINKVSYIIDSSGKIVGQVGNAAKVVSLKEGVLSVLDSATKISTPVAEKVVGKGISTGALEISNGAKLIEATTGKVLTTVGDAGALFTKIGALKLILASSKYAVIFRVASHALNVVTVASTLCDVGALSYIIYSAGDAGKQMAESARLADDSLKKIVNILDDKTDMLTSMEGKLWTDYNAQIEENPEISLEINESINKIHEEVLRIIALDIVMHNSYVQFSTNEEKQTLPVLSNLNPFKRKTASEFSDREYKNLKADIAQLRTQIISVEQELNEVKSKLELYIYSE